MRTLPLLFLLSSSSVLLAQEPYISAEGSAPLPLGLPDLAGGFVEDVDGDGHLDVLAWGGFGAEQVLLLLGDGAGSFVDASQNVAGGVEADEAVLIDVDSDGDKDLVVALDAQSSILLADGTGQYALDPAPSPFAPILFSRGLLAEDFNGDGVEDVLEAQFSSPATLYLGDGAGSFSASVVPMAAETSDYWRAQSGDLNADGAPDLLMATLNAPFVLLNDGAGGFPTATTLYDVFAPNPRGIDLGDVDLDGDLDALVGSVEGNATDRLLVNDGTGTMSLAFLPNVSSSSRDVLLRDFDSDGDLDALGVETEPRVYLGNGTVFFTNQPGSYSGPEMYGETALAGDFDEDGDLDVLTDTRNPERLALLYNDGAAHFQGFADESPFGTDLFARAITSGDYDGDGDVDTVRVNSESIFGPGAIYLHLNDGAGSFVLDAGPQPGNPYLVESLATADLDGDQDLDVFVGNTKWTGAQSTGIGINFPLFNDGSGAFTIDFAAFPQSGKNTWEVMLGDVDLDGDVDALMANGSAAAASGNELWLNNGSGQFTNVPSQLPPAPGHSFSGELGDFDQDGDLDAVMGQGLYAEFPSSFARNLYLQNEGAGNFTSQPTKLPGQLEFTRAITSGDVDGDGDLDLVLGNAKTNAIGAQAPGDLQPDRLYINDGAGNFSDATGTQLPVYAEWTSNVLLLDVDGDDDLDLFSMNSASFGWSNGALFLNDGSGQYTQAALPSHRFSFLEEATLADFDRDGDVDVGSLYVVGWNLARQLEWKSAPSIDNKVDFQVRGPKAGGPWTVAFSAATAEIAIPPFGLLQINPVFGYGVLGSGLLDADRAGIAQAAIPNDAALVGATLYFQAVVGFPLRLTNRASLTLFDL